METIGRAFPSRPWINDRISRRAAHGGPPSSKIHNVCHQLLVPVVRLSATASATTLKRASRENVLDPRNQSQSERFRTGFVVGFSLCNAKPEYTLWDADYCFGSSAFHCRLFFSFGCLAGCTASVMSDAEQHEITKSFFERMREEMRDAITLEEERRAALVKNLCRLRALRLSRDRNEPIEQAWTRRLCTAAPTRYGQPASSMVSHWRKFRT